MAHLEQVEAAIVVLTRAPGIVALTCQVGVDVQTPVGAANGFGLQGRNHVHHAGPLLEEAVGQIAGPAYGRAGGRHQPALDLVRRQPGARLQHQGDDAGDHRGGLRGSRHDEIGAAVVKLGVFFGDLREAGHQRQHVAAGRHQLGLDEALDGGSGRRERGQQVVAPLVGRVVVAHRPDRDDVGHVPRHAHGHRPRTAVAGGDDDAQPGRPGPHHRLVQRIVPVVGARRGAERQVEHADAVRLLVGHHPVEPADDVGVGALAVGVEGLDRDQVGVGGDAVIGAVVRARAAEDHALHVGAVAALVVADDADADPLAAAISPGDDLVRDRVVLGEEAPGAVGVLVERDVRHRPGIDDGDADAPAGDALLMQPRGFGEGRVVCRGIARGFATAAGFAGRLYLGVCRDSEAVDAAQLVELLGCDLRRNGIDDAQLVRNIAVYRSNGRDDVLERLALHDLGDRLVNDRPDVDLFASAKDEGRTGCEKVDTDECEECSAVHDAVL